MEKTLLEKALCMMLKTKTTQVFWAEVDHTAYHILINLQRHLLTLRL